MAFKEKDVGKNVGDGRAAPVGTALFPSAIDPSSGPGRPRCTRVQALLAAGLLGLAALGSMADARARPTGEAAAVALADLPPEARQTQARILAGGPFPYAKDGVVFYNREQRLERHPRGYYHEYTVPTPGAHDRGARRIICGGTRVTEPDACFYTEDHYNTFHRIIK